MVSKSIVALALALTLAACGKTQAVKPDPIPEGCDASCRTPCVVDDSITYHPDPQRDALDEMIRQVVAPLLGEIKQCDAQRVACVQCLDRLKAAGITQ